MSGMADNQVQNPFKTPTRISGFSYELHNPDSPKQSHSNSVQFMTCTGKNIKLETYRHGCDETSTDVCNGEVKVPALGVCDEAQVGHRVPAIMQISPSHEVHIQRASYIEELKAKGRRLFTTEYNGSYFNNE